MAVLSNKGAKSLLLGLAALLALGALAVQCLVYAQAASMKQAVTRQHEALAGRLSGAFPNLSPTEIASLFASEPRAEDAAAGRQILSDAAYDSGAGTPLWLPSLDASYRTYAAWNGAASILFGTLLLLTAYWFIRRTYLTLEAYQEEVYRMMDGGTASRMNDTEEGSLSKLAAAMNTLISSLRAHIEKEKRHRLFLKDTMTNISHQLKTPLSALSMYNEIMQGESVDNEAVVHFLHKSGQELDRMERLIANLLKLARLDAGIIELHPKQTSLNELVRRAAGSLETRLAREGKSLNVQADRTLHYCCDPEWLLEAVSNLLTNALDHSAPGQTVTVRLGETPLSVHIEVADQGEGIHPEDMHHLFKPFYRSRFSQNKQGTGIGLTLAKAIAELHGGYIALDSKPGHGAKFALHLPKLTKP